MQVINQKVTLLCLWFAESILQQCSSEHSDVGLNCGVEQKSSSNGSYWLGTQTQTA